MTKEDSILIAKGLYQHLLGAGEEIVAAVKHRDGSTAIGIVKDRGVVAIAKSKVGKHYASWAYVTKAGTLRGEPQKFKTYDDRQQAIDHAAYAAQNC